MAKASKKLKVGLIGAGAGVIFKGSGFYQTDYRSASYKKAHRVSENPLRDAEGKAARGLRAHQG